MTGTAGPYERALAAVTNLRTAPATDAEVERLTAEAERLRTAIEQAMAVLAGFTFGNDVEAFNILRTALTPGAES